MGVQDDHLDYQRGLRGQSPLTANNAFAWAAGDAARKQKEGLQTPLSGEEHPNAWQIFILAGVVAAVIAALLEWQLVPPVLTVSWWRVGGLWLVVTTAGYFVLRALPAWLAGGIMGLGLGGTAAYLGWLYLSPLWALGLGLGIGGLMYLAFSSLE
jgi:hypothetical protein